MWFGRAMKTRRTRTISVPTLIVQALFLLAVFLPSCGGNGEPSFVLGWVMLGAFVLFMLILLVGIVRYIRGGRTAPPPKPQAQDLDFVYQEEDDEED